MGIIASDAVVKAVQTKFRKEECAGGTEQRSHPNDAAVKDAQI